LDTPETQGITSVDKHLPNEFMAEYRAAVTRALTSERLKAIIKQKGIQLVSYGDIAYKRFSEPEAHHKNHG